MSEQPVTLGRPKDEKTSVDILAATLQLVRLHGYEAVSITAIAKQAGVAKQTIYNRWSTKADLVLEAVFKETGRIAAAVPDDEQTSCQQQLYLFLCNVFEHLSYDARVLAALIAAAQKDEAFREAFKKGFVKPREAMLIEILNRAQQRGELSKHRDVSILSAFVHGAFWYALLQGDTLNSELAQSLVAEIFWQG